MPTLNVYFRQNSDVEKMQPHISSLQSFVAEQLTCGDIALTSEEVSIRFLIVSGGTMIAPVEVEILAHSFAERVERQDEVCLAVRDYIKKEVDLDVKVWLQLSELGHSWEAAKN